MSLKTAIQVIFRPVGADKIKKAFSGITGDAQKASNAQKRAAAQATAAVQRGAAQAGRAEDDLRKKTEQAAQGATESTTKAQRKRRGELKKTEQEAKRVEEEIRKTRRRTDREEDGGGGGGRRRRQRDTSFGNRVGNTVGLGRALVGEVANLGGMIGVPSREEMVGRAMDFERSLIRLGNQAGLDDAGRGQLKERILATSQQQMVDPSQILEAMNVAQNRFSNLDFFSSAENMNALAAAASALDTPLADVVGAVGEMQRQMGVTAAQMPELVGMMSQAARNGSIEFNDISSEFATQIGTFRRTFGVGGMEGARQMIAGAQALGAGGANPAETATLMANLMAKMTDRRTMQQFSRAGVRTTDDNGQFVGLDNLIQQIATNDRFDSAAEMQRLMPDLQARTALGILVDQVRQAPPGQNPITDLMNSSAAEGNAVIEQTQTDLRGSTAGRAAQVGIDAQAGFLRNGEQLIQVATDLARPLAELNSEFPLFSQAVSSATNVLSEFAQFAGMWSLASGGAAAAAGGAAASGAGGVAAAGGLAALGGTAVTGASAGAVGGAMLPGLLAFAGLTKAMGTEEEVSNFFTGNWSLDGSGLFGGEDAANGGSAEEIRRRIEANAQRARAQGAPQASPGGAQGTQGGPVPDPSTDRNTAATDAQTRATQDLSRTMERVARDLRSNSGSGPNPGETPVGGP